MSRTEELKKGDLIECQSANEAVDLMPALEREDINTDFCYEHDGKKGIWIEIVKIGYKR